jgi:hypothetical protein
MAQSRFVAVQAVKYHAAQAPLATCEFGKEGRELVEPPRSACPPEVT